MFFCRNKEFRQRLETIRPRLYRLAYSWSHQKELSDDLAQETLMRAIRGEHQLKEMDGFDNWVFKILINCWRNYLTRNREMDNIDDYIISDEASPENLHERQHVTECVKQAVSFLPQGQRQVLTLVDLEGCSYAEVSTILEIPIGTVMSRLCRARKTLAGLLLEHQNQFENREVMLRRIK